MQIQNQWGLPLMGFLVTEGENTLANGEATAIMELLTVAYPGHPWGVRVDGGIIFIRYMDPEMPGNWGMVIKRKDVDHDAAVLKREVIRMAGEWLERAGLKRGREDGSDIERVEGLSDKYQPTHRPLDMEVVIAADKYEPVRTEPRPQAVKDEL